MEHWAKHPPKNSSPSGGIFFGSGSPPLGSEEGGGLPGVPPPSPLRKANVHFIPCGGHRIACANCRRPSVGAEFVHEEGGQAPSKPSTQNTSGSLQSYPSQPAQGSVPEQVGWWCTLYCALFFQPVHHTAPPPPVCELQASFHPHLIRPPVPTLPPLHTRERLQVQASHVQTFS